MKPVPLTLRPAAPEDLPTIAALMNRAFRAAGPNASWNTEAPFITGERTNPAALAEDLAAKPQASLLTATLTPGNAIEACVWLTPITPETWYLGSLTIDPILQNAGLGRQLLEASEQWAAQHGARTIQIWVVNLRDTLIAWYQRRGYILTGQTRPFPYGDTRFGTPLRPDLSFLILEKPLH